MHHCSFKSSYVVLVYRSSLPDKEEGNRGELVNPGSPEKGLLKWRHVRVYEIWLG